MFGMVQVPNKCWLIKHNEGRSKDTVTTLTFNGILHCKIFPQIHILQILIDSDIILTEAKILHVQMVELSLVTHPHRSSNRNTSYLVLFSGLKNHHWLLTVLIFQY